MQREALQCDAGDKLLYIKYKQGGKLLDSSACNNIGLLSTGRKTGGAVEQARRMMASEDVPDGGTGMRAVAVLCGGKMLSSLHECSSFAEPRCRVTC